ncbi:MAG: hypothetical protein ACJA0G_002425, partial [Kangiellaceae bacterium]
FGVYALHIKLDFLLLWSSLWFVSHVYFLLFTA